LCLDACGWDLILDMGWAPPRPQWAGLFYFQELLKGCHLTSAPWAAPPWGRRGGAADQPPAALDCPGLWPSAPMLRIAANECPGGKGSGLFKAGVS